MSYGELTLPPVWTGINKQNKRFTDVPIYDTMPDGWAEMKGATTAPNGYVWINNCKSIFSKKYRHALLKVKHW